MIMPTVTSFLMLRIKLLDCVNQFHTEAQSYWALIKEKAVRMWSVLEELAGHVLMAAVHRPIYSTSEISFHQAGILLSWKTVKVECFNILLDNQWPVEIFHYIIPMYSCAPILTLAVSLSYPHIHPHIHSNQHCTWCNLPNQQGISCTAPTYTSGEDTQ